MGQIQESSGPAVGSSSPHCLLLPFPVQGHINPFMQLGKRLASHRVRVTVAIIEHIHAKIQRAQQLSLNPNFQTLPIPDGLPPDLDREEWSDEMATVVNKTLADGALKVVQTLASQGHPITCIVGDFHLRWTCFVAEKAAVPEYVFWPQNASMLSLYLHEHAIIASGYDPFEGNVIRATVSREATPMELITCIPGFTRAIHPADLPYETPFGKSTLELVRDMLRERFNCMGKARMVIGNSFEALEPEAVQALQIEFQQGKPHPQYSYCWPRYSFRVVGPLVPRAVVASDHVDAMEDDADLRSGGSFWEEEVEECKEWLDAQPVASVLFVAFGSIMTMSVSQVRELAMGLEASGQKFLWVLRKRAITKAGLKDSSDSSDSAFKQKREFVGLEEALPEKFVERNQRRCKVVSWAPQALVLSHPAVGGFFSHCGWNSTLESLCCGVPLLGWPWLLDQVTNCWLVSHVWEVGLTLQRDEDNQATRAYVESGARQLMEGPLSTSLRAKARDFRALAREAAQREEGVLRLVEDICSLA